ncbi:MAG: CpaD family pilus assembly protein [Hyphomicrobiales bacterium]|nr:CpaD family pilus assembly protein [Hyphomicrobiales bacterium]
MPLPAARRPALSAARLLALLGCAATLAGCYTNDPIATPVAFDYRLRHPISISEGPRTVQLFIGESRGGLNGDQRADVLAFAKSWRQEATGGVVIELPSGTRNEIAAANAVHEVRAILAAAGVPPQSTEVRPYRPAEPGKLATLRLNYPTTRADAGPCGQWPRDLGPTWDREHNENMEYYNFGCASQRNLAAMVENKADLVQPRGEVPPYTGRRTTVLDKYHRGESTETQYPDKDKGKISDVGK